MINQSSAARDYQKFLELNILKLNHKSFHQIVVLGSSSFIPFMQLPAQHRRAVIEDLLDINIFSKMNTLLKEEIARIKESIKTNTYNVDLTKEKINLQKDYIRKIAQVNDESIKKLQDKITELTQERTELEQSNADISEGLTEKLSKLEKELAALELKREKFVNFKSQFDIKISTLVKETKFYDDNDHCPTCTQEITGFLKEKKKSDAKTKAQELQRGIKKVDDEIQGIDLDISVVNGDLNQVRGNESQMTLNNNSISNITRQIDAAHREIEGFSSNTGDLSQANKELNNLRDELETLNEQRVDLSDKQGYQLACAEMLKDTGIKTKIIREYLPAMNNLINQYLQVLDFFVSFNLDENFSETIKSRHRDNFNYASFSEGEKQRIDLALLFTWRQIAKMKNSTSTNLLVLDETFDSSLDHDGVDNLIKILDTLDDKTNVFIISHKGDVLDGKFRSKIEFKKEKNFSIISN